MPLKRTETGLGSRRIFYREILGSVDFASSYDGFCKFLSYFEAHSILRFGIRPESWRFSGIAWAFDFASIGTLVSARLADSKITFTVPHFELAFYFGAASASVLA